MIHDPQPIPVGSEPPPLQPSPNGSNGRPPRHPGAGKAKGKPARRKTADRFAVLNAFVDAGMAGLSRAEVMTWLVLYRDTRDGTACVSIEGIAGRTGMSKRQTMRAVETLCRKGLLTRIYKGNLNRGSSRYRVWPLPNPPSNR